MGQKDHDASVRLTAELAALDRLVQTQLRDREVALKVATDETHSQVDRLNERLAIVIDAQSALMPRAEAKLLIDALGARLDAMQKGLGDLAQTIAALRSSLSGQTSGVAAAEKSADRSRTLVFAVLGVAVAVLGTVITLLLAFR